MLETGPIATRNGSNIYAHGVPAVGIPRSMSWGPLTCQRLWTGDTASCSGEATSASITSWPRWQCTAWDLRSVAFLFHSTAFPIPASAFAISIGCAGILKTAISGTAHGRAATSFRSLCSICVTASKPTELFISLSVDAAGEPPLQNSLGAASSWQQGLSPWRMQPVRRFCPFIHFAKRRDVSKSPSGHQSNSLNSQWQFDYTAPSRLMPNV